MVKKKNFRRSGNRSQLPLERIELDIDEDEPIPEPVERFLEQSQTRMQEYWDRWTERPIEQYVACDFRYVWGALQRIKQKDLLKGNSFVEWGCGFGVVTALAWYAGLSAVGIEAERFLVEEGRKLLDAHGIHAELWHGNFLPKGAEALAMRQAEHPSLYHPIPPAYGSHDCELDDFAMVFAYPWPGEEHFQREVFFRYAAHHSLLLMFRGPYHIELYRQNREP